MTTKYIVDLENGQVTLRGASNKVKKKGRGGNSMQKEDTDLFWEAADSVVFDLEFESVVDINGSGDPAPAWPFEQILDQQPAGAAQPTLCKVTNATRFKAELGDPALIGKYFKYTIRARKQVEAELDPMIIIEK
jgi:hypothetical protein